MAASFSFQVEKTDGAARTGLVRTPHGEIRTPAFMPVGTQATVKGLHPERVRATGADILLGNTYHLMLRPGAERVARLGGLHRFMNWPHAILTDSGGFQVMSLASLRRVTEQAVTFRSHIDGSSHELSPERAVEIQRLLGSDIAMQLDECVRLPAPRDEIERAMELSLRWAQRSLAAFDDAHGGALFGIVQGGDEAALRRTSAQALAAMPFHGLAIGGLAVGEPQAVMLAMVEAVTPLLPADKPRYLMGVGTPSDMLGAIARGVDMFDCVLPTRNGRHGVAFTHGGPLNLRNARHADDPTPIDAGASSEVARTYSRAYLHHLVKANEMLGAMLLSEINIAYFQDLMAAARRAVVDGRLSALEAEIHALWGPQARDGAANGTAAQ